MKSILKKGFTLTELLLCIAIIAIITAMGGAIAKNSAEKAFNNYFFYGFANLYDATFENGNRETNTINNYANKLEDIFNENNSGAACSGTPTTCTVTTSNGISYEITEIITDSVYQIQMSVPAMKTRATPNGIKRTRIIYMRTNPTTNRPIMFPAAPNAPQQTFDVNLLDGNEAILLLPTYINRGENPIVTSAAGERQKRPIQYVNYNDAFCSINGVNLTDQNGITYITCAAGSTPTPGVIQFANPSKIRL